MKKGVRTAKSQRQNTWGPVLWQDKSKRSAVAGE